jgi:hypothetical protein
MLEAGAKDEIANHWTFERIEASASTSIQKHSSAVRLIIGI